MHPNPPSHPTSDISHPTFLPDLTNEDKDWIDTWFDHDSRLPEIAKELHTTVLELATWSNQPHIRQAFAFIKHIAHERTDTLQAEADHQALNRLLSLARFSNHEETARRAAMNVLTWRRPSRTRAIPKPLPEEGVGLGAIRSPTQATEEADHQNATFQNSNLKSLPPKPLPEGRVGVGSFRSPTQATHRADHPQSTVSSSQVSNSKSSSLPISVSAPLPHSIPPSVPQCLRVSPPFPHPSPTQSTVSPSQVSNSKSSSLPISVSAPLPHSIPPSVPQCLRVSPPFPHPSPTTTLISDALRFQTSNLESPSLPVPVPALSPSPWLRVSVPPCQSSSAQTEAEPRSR